MSDYKLCDTRNVVANKWPRRNAAPVAEPTKQLFRIKCWKKMKNARIGIGFIYNRIPSFVGIEKAASKLCETDEFKMIANVKVSSDRVLYDVMLKALEARKVLYVNALRESTALYNRVDMPNDCKDAVKREVLGARNVMHKYLTAVDIENRVPIDMIVIGSLVVSRQGQRIGRGKGAADLEIGLLIELGVITPSTCIVTIVHDIQVVNHLPMKLFQKFDTPIDLIVTPSQVIRINNGSPRPAGIFWDLLTQRHLRAFPVFKHYKAIQEAKGKTIVLRNSLRVANETQIASNGAANSAGGNAGEGDGVNVTQAPVKQQQQQRRRHRNRRWHRQRKNNTAANDNPTQPTTTMVKATLTSPTRSATESSKVGNNVATVGINNDVKSSRRRARTSRDICVKLSNLTPDVRIKDVKMELRRRDCNPMSILWIGRLGKCFLHFGNRNGTPCTKDDIEKVMNAMRDLTLTIEHEDANQNENAEEDGCGDTHAMKIYKVVKVQVELVNYGRLIRDAPLPIKTE